MQETVRSARRSVRRGLSDGLAAVPGGRRLALEAKTLLDSRWRTSRPKHLDATVTRWLAELERSGICVVPGLVSPASCAELRAEVDEAMRRYSESVTHDRAGADHRVFLGPTPPGGLGAIFDHPMLVTAARGVLGQDVTNVALLAGRIQATPGNRGSGGGWHRDSYTNQFKSIIYLTDVDEANGPMQYISGSHATKAKADDDRLMDVPLGQRPRYTAAQTKKLIDADPQRVLTVVAPAGSAILVDTTGIHRGMPIRRGQRYSLTNYFYPSRLVDNPRFRPRFTIVTPGG
jgi:hypothetical protein